MRHTSANWQLSLVLLGLASLSFGCASSFNTTITPGITLNDYKTFYVEKLPVDKRRIDFVIRDELNRLGLAAAAGPASERPTYADAVVTYEDRWMWDITMYMLSLKIDIRDASTNVLLATGKTSYTSLIRQTPTFMAREILTTIFRGKRPTGDEEPRQQDEQVSEL